MLTDTLERGSSVVLRADPEPSAVAVLATADDLAYRIAELGPARFEAELARFVQAAQCLGADPVLGSVVLDRSAPDVTRQRAFGVLHRQLARRAVEA
jgi:hypothetical protein